MTLTPPVVGTGRQLVPEGASTDPVRIVPLDAALLAAHDRDDRRALVGLYEEAAAGAEGIARAFYLTHAYVYALEQGDPRTPALKGMLVEIGADIA